LKPQNESSAQGRIRRVRKADACFIPPFHGGIKQDTSMNAQGIEAESFLCRRFTAA
jgi:hypothetical protein